jgi:hypothetical protein
MSQDEMLDYEETMIKSMVEHWTARGLPPEQIALQVERIRMQYNDPYFRAMRDAMHSLAQSSQEGATIQTFMEGLERLSCYIEMPNQEETMIKNFVSALPSMGCPAEQVKLEEERFRTMLNDPELRAKREQLRQEMYARQHALQSGLPGGRVSSILLPPNRRTCLVVVH